MCLMHSMYDVTFVYVLYMYKILGYNKEGDFIFEK